ncbi:MAG: hypothetical protein R3B53_00650 [Candidatus Paceibacterota bacterium]
MALPQRKNEPQVNQPNPGQVRSVKKVFGYGGENLGTGRTASNDDSHYSSLRPTVDSTFAESGYGRSDMMMQPTGLGGQTKEKKGANQPEEERISEEEETRAFHRQNTRRILGKQKLPTSLSSAKNLVAKTRVTTINSAAVSWQGPLWLTFQVPMAIFNIITLAMFGVVDSLATDNNNPFTWAVGKLTSAANSLVSMAGFSLADFATGIFFITTIAILAFGIASIFFLYLQYTMAGLKPLSGTHAGLKLGMLLLVILGYSIPIANMLPFVFLWMAVVWFYPK